MMGEWGDVPGARQVKHRILIVDDEDAIRFAVCDFLESRGYAVDEAASCEAALAQVRTSRPDVIVADHQLPDGTALDLLAQMKAIDPGLPLVVLTGHGTIDLAVRAIKEGAEQFLTKPVELPALLVVLERVLERTRTRQRHLADRSRGDREAVDPFVGSSPAIRQLAADAHKVLASASPVLLRGETGSGKGVLAQWLHRHGRRADEAFVDVNCAGLSPELLESELFGHERGAFTGAIASKPGLFEIAHRGTVFLDEIGDTDMAVQGKLLKVLEEKRFRRLGEVRDRRADVQLVAATHRDLRSLVEDGRFRSDLYYRISTVVLAVPPLRERAEDIPILARQMLARLSADLQRGRVELAVEAEAALQAYTWPGNIRELRNVLERAVLLSDQAILGPRNLRFDSLLTPAELAFVESHRDSALARFQDVAERIIRGDRCVDQLRSQDRLALVDGIAGNLAYDDFSACQILKRRVSGREVLHFDHFRRDPRPAHEDQAFDAALDQAAIDQGHHIGVDPAIVTPKCARKRAYRQRPAPAQRPEQGPAVRRENPEERFHGFEGELGGMHLPLAAIQALGHRHGPFRESIQALDVEPNLAHSRLPFLHHARNRRAASRTLRTDKALPDPDSAGDALARFVVITDNSLSGPAIKE
jgi:DNA-binding NtrC family response regulator